MFGIGYQEIFVIMVVALVVVGPQKLPEMAGQVGRWVREFRKMTTDLTGEFSGAMAEIDDITNEFKRELTGVTNDVKKVTKSVDADLKAGQKAKPAAARAAAKTPVKPAVAKAAASPSRLPLATKADPLSDVADLDDSLLRGPVTKPTVTGVEIIPAKDPALASVRRRRLAAAYAQG